MKTAKQMRAEHVGEVTLYASPIEAAKAQRAMDALRFMGTWIDASLELPPDTEMVLVHAFNAHSWVWLGWYEDGTWRTVNGTRLTRVDHWADLPEGPKP